MDVNIVVVGVADTVTTGSLLGPCVAISVVAFGLKSNEGQFRVLAPM